MISDIDCLAEQQGVDRSEMIRRLLIEGSRRVSERQTREKAKLKKAETTRKTIIAEVLSEAEPTPAPQPVKRLGWQRTLSPEIIKAIADRAEKKK
jgi:hypothetical protein